MSGLLLLLPPQPPSPEPLLSLHSRYFRGKEIDPDSVWFGLCERERTATAWCQTFLSDYVEHAVRSVMVLGPEEYEDRRVLNSAATVLGMWRSLVKEADLTVLAKRRQRDPSAAAKWKLRYQTPNPRFSSSADTAFEVTQVRFLRLPPDLTKHGTGAKSPSGYVPSSPKRPGSPSSSPSTRSRRPAQTSSCSFRPSGHAPPSWASTPASVSRFTGTR